MPGGAMVLIQRGLEALLELQLWPLRLSPPPIKLKLSNCSETPGRNKKAVRQEGSTVIYISSQCKNSLNRWVLDVLNLDAQTGCVWRPAGVNLNNSNKWLPANMRVKGETNYPCTKNSWYLQEKTHNFEQRKASLRKRECILLKNHCSFCRKVECIVSKRSNNLPLQLYTSEHGRW